MEHPPKQGLKHVWLNHWSAVELVLMEHPPKQGLKHQQSILDFVFGIGFNGTSTKTRIETSINRVTENPCNICFNGTSTKTRIETQSY